MFCCTPMALLVEDPRCPLKYHAPTRRYLLTVPSSYLKKNEIGMSYLITNCPRCGTKLPPSLADQWFKIIKKEYQIEGALDERIQDLPQEFKTDEWWKKRGL